MTTPIVLRAKSSKECTGVVRLSSDAEKVVRRLKERTGLSASRIVSEILCQAENLIEIHTDDLDDAEDMD